MPSFANVHTGIVAVDSIQSLAYVLKIGCFVVVQFYLLQEIKVDACRSQDAAMVFLSTPPGQRARTPIRN